MVSVADRASRQQGDHFFFARMSVDDSVIIEFLTTMGKKIAFCAVAIQITILWGSVSTIRICNMRVEWGEGLLPFQSSKYRSTEYINYGRISQWRNKRLRILFEIQSLYGNYGNFVIAIISLSDNQLNSEFEENAGSIISRGHRNLKGGI